MLNEHHIKHTRHPYQLFRLYMLKQSTYLEYCENVKGDKYHLICGINIRKLHLSSVQFLVNCNGQLLMTCFVHSLKEGDIKLYVQACDELCSCFLALDYTNYARWLPVHIRDMIQLAEKCPNFHDNFMKGYSLCKNQLKGLVP